jgi:hypothetical protein
LEPITKVLKTLQISFEAGFEGLRHEASRRCYRG